ncbi:MAG TPA: choice-of-anchor L domain-containing protein [Kofleriaceae bacterium]
MVGACGPEQREPAACVGADCMSGLCKSGEKRECYTGSKESLDVGPCAAGMQVCTGAGQWGNCVGEVKPQTEVCGDGEDNNCDGGTDNDVDLDGDGFTTCGGDCCDSTECGSPNLVNPSAFDSPGNTVDDDCNGSIDDSLALCDQGMMSSSTNAKDFAKAIDICQEATLADRKWGLLAASLTLPDGTGTPDPNAHSIRNHFGAKVMPRGGVSMALLSSGVAAGKGDVNPAYQDFVSYSGTMISGFPADFVAANGGTLPNAPGCDPPNGTDANDPVMLNLEIRVPSNAHSFSLKSNFYSAEFPEWTCSPYNDFFVVLLDSTYTGNPANPMDKNLAFYTAPNMMNYPVGVNLAFGNTGLFTQCVNGTTGCSGTAGSISTCISTDDLLNTGFDDAAGGQCDGNALKGGATGWLTTSGNVTPGEVIKLRVAIWDTSDSLYDSLAIIDGFQWSVDSTQPGTVILRSDQPTNPKALDSTRPVSTASDIQ